MPLDKLVRVAANRRAFLKTAGASAMGLAGGAVLISKLPFAENKVEAASYSEAGIINFALNLEYLEAEFHAMSTYGSTLRAALGSSAAKKPAIDLDALGYGFSSIDSWLKLGRQFEDVGVSAYLGAAGGLAGNVTYLSTAAAILATEAQHSGTLRWGCIMNGVR